MVRRLTAAVRDKLMLLQLTSSVLQASSNVRLRPPLIDQIVDLLEFSHHLLSETEAGTTRQEQLQNGLHGIVHKSLLPQSFKILEDTKTEVRQRGEKLLRKIYSIIGQQVLDACPKNKQQKVTDICLAGQPARVGVPLGSSGGQANPSGVKEFGTGTFGASGNQLLLNSRN